MTETMRKAALNGLKQDFKVAMVLNGLTGETLARKLHVSHATACRWLREPEKLTIEQIRQLNAVLHIQSGENLSRLCGF